MITSLESAASRAAEGVVNLLFRDDWATEPMGQQVRIVARRLLDHPEDTVRAIAVRALPRIEPEPATRLTLIASRLRADDTNFVYAALLQQLLILFQELPTQADSSLVDLGTTDAWPYLSPDQQEFDDPRAATAQQTGMIDYLIQILIWISLRGTQTRCELLLKTWLDSPVDHSHRAERTCVHLRDWLTAGDTDSIPIRRHAFALLARPVTTAAALRQAAGTSPEKRLAIEPAIRVAVAVARELKIAADTAKPMPDDYAANAFPLLEELACIGVPAITHDIVRLTQRIAPADPKRALLAVATAIDNTPDYVREPEGARVVLELIDSYAADHRSLMLDDAECTSALRRILEHFVALGVDAAVERTRDLGEMFR